MDFVSYNKTKKIQRPKKHMLTKSFTFAGSVGTPREDPVAEGVVVTEKGAQNHKI